MNPWDVVPATAALGWAALVVNLVVIPFYSASEKWHKDYVDSGTLAQAAASIDSKKLFPSLAEIVDMVVAERGKTKSKDPTVTLLGTVDFLPALEKAEAATREKSQLDEDLDKLRLSAKKMWRWGLVHILATAAAWAVVAFLRTSPSFEQQAAATPVPASASFWVGIVVTGLLWLVSLGLVSWNFWKYDRRRDAFFANLKANR